MPDSDFLPGAFEQLLEPLPETTVREAMDLLREAMERTGR